jgi:glycosyltransferase involved in cell wall biosynthesis
MYGSDGISNQCDYFLKNPSLEEKNYLYNKCNIWLAPTCLEGLHIPPAEAGITECCVVGTNAELNGMSDYLIDYGTGLISKNNYEDFKSKVKIAIESKKIRNDCGENLRLRIMEIGSREYNMNKFVKLMEN